MKYKLDNTLTDEEYFCCRKFTSLHYGKKARSLARLTACLMIFVFLGFFFKAEGVTTPSIITGAVLILWLIIWQIIYKPLCVRRIKKNIAAEKKKGKKLYSKQSVMEFYDDYFRDITENMKYEVNYSVVASVSIVENKIIILHTDNGIIFFLPVSVFETKEQCDDFLSFIKTKCSKVDYFDKI